MTKRHGVECWRCKYTLCIKNVPYHFCE